TSRNQRKRIRLSSDISCQCACARSKARWAIFYLPVSGRAVFCPVYFYTVCCSFRYCQCSRRRSCWCSFYINIINENVVVECCTGCSCVGKAQLSCSRNTGERHYSLLPCFR